MNMQTRKTLLLAEDDDAIADDFASLLKKNGYQVITVITGEEVVTFTKKEPVDLILMDIDSGSRIDGIKTANEILSVKEIPIIFLVSDIERDLGEEIRNIIRFGYVMKNSSSFVLLSSIEMTFELFELRKKAREVIESQDREKLLLEKEERLRLALIAGNQGLYDLDLKTGIAKVNASYAQMLGYEYEGFEDTIFKWKERLHPDDRDFTYGIFEEYAKGIRKEYKEEFRQRTLDGSWKWVLSQGRIVEWDKDNQPIRMLGTHTDITERKHFELSQKARTDVLDELIAKQELSIILKEIIHKIESIHPEMRASIILLDSEGKLTTGAAPSLPDFYNEALNGLVANVGVGSCGTAAATGELVIVEDIQNHEYWKEFIEIAGKAELRACWSVPFKDDSGKVLGTFAAYYDLPRYPTQSELNIIYEFSRIAGLAVQNNKNEMERIKAEEEVKSLLIEKEILLKEVHHRIKNNMASVSSLLSLQADYVDDPKVVKILEEAQNRILSMMLIYDKLYKSTDYKNISIKEYLYDLLDQILLSFPGNARIKIEKQIEDFILNSKSLFSVGIILNELITNAFKYAFPDNREGQIIICINKLEGDKIELTVIDSGVGLPEGFSISDSKGFGLNLIRMLTQKKGNSFESVSENGTKFKIVIAV